VHYLDADTLILTNDRLTVTADQLEYETMAPSRGGRGCIITVFVAQLFISRTCIICLLSPSPIIRVTPQLQQFQQQNSLRDLGRGGGGAIVIAHSHELGGDIIRILAGPDVDNDDNDDDEYGNAGFLTAVGVPTFAVVSGELSRSRSLSSSSSYYEYHLQGRRKENKPRRMGLEGILRNANAFIIENAISVKACESIIRTCDELGFGNYNAGKNHHGAIQIVITKGVADELLRVIGPHVDLDGVIAAHRELLIDDHDVDITEEKMSFALTGINRRLRVYRYETNSNERFAPHIDAGFPPGGTSLDDADDDQNDDDDSRSRTTSRTPHLYWDASHQYQSSSAAREVVSRLTVLIYLNDDFNGGHTKFYEPACDRESKHNDDVSGEEGINVIASIKPRAGSILVFPQAVSEIAVERARNIWPLHEGSPVTSTADSSNRSRPKYVIRTDVLFEKISTNSENESLPPEERVLFQHDDVVRNVFLNASPMFSTTFLHHVWPLYNPHMGVENVGPLLYSLVRFTKVRNIVEVGAGYTTLFLLQALKDNDVEMRCIVKLNDDDKLRLLDYPFGTQKLDEWASTSSLKQSASSLLCIDNCEHQKETASSAVHVSRTLNLDPYLQFLKGDAFDALDTHFSHDETIDMLWCDFGVGKRMAEYVSRVWRYIRPGGFLVCHSTLTNERTRLWLEGVRRRAGVDVTGIPAGEYAELSLLEPHKRFQNSITIIQKRTRFEEPIYSEYA